MPIDSPLSFFNTETFRNGLVVRNLQPYTVAGSYTPPVAQQNFEYVQSNFSVIDSPDSLIADPPSNLVPPQYHGLYVLNEYGPEGGYGVTITQSLPLVQNSNAGEYNVMDASLPEQSLVGQGWPNYAQVTAEQNIPALNKYSFDEVFLEQINNLQFVPTFSFYANPTPVSFLPSSYTPYTILFDSNPQGSDGSITQDSQLAQLGATFLKDALQYRIDREIERNTFGRENLSEALSDPVALAQVASGRIPLIEKNYSITVPENPIDFAANFLLKLSGTYFPASPIPGDYFDEDMAQWRPTAANQIVSAFAGGRDPRTIFGSLDTSTNYSQVFLSNTGQGQRSTLFNNIDYNKYKPRYNRGLARNIGRGLLEIIERLTDGEEGPVSDFYIGQNNSEPSDIFSPPGQLPTNSVGQQVKSPVIGPDAMGKLYEGENQNFKFGLNGTATINAGGIAGGFVWTSQGYNNPGFGAKVGGDFSANQDPEFNQISGQFDGSFNSTNINFKNGSILDNTQRLLDSTPAGAERLGHVGNAINQLSKVFHDGYRELTKGSRVVSYTYDAATNQHGGGVEYCRVFAKDTPYYTYNDLQKTDGITTSGRKFTYSIIDNTYNLNIAPLRNPGSTNIIDNKVKKYMFSIENLAWRTSNRPGFTYDDLPVCERGPNGGRVMWFPPYDLSFSETISPRFDATEILGRPEPIYTYRNTSRGGSLSWKMVVDHPSVLNTITNKILQNESNVERVNSIVDSFFAGCLKYDLYELARRFTTIPTRDLFTYQQIITNPAINADQLAQVAGEAGITTSDDPSKVIVGNEGTNGTNAGNGTSTPGNTNTSGGFPEFKNKWINLGWYFHNDIPGPKQIGNPNPSQTWDVTYTAYIGMKSQYQANGGSATNKEEIANTFTNVIEYNAKIEKDFQKEIVELITKNPKINKITITMAGSASAPQTKTYNDWLSKRRINSVLQYLAKNPDLNKWINGETKKIVIKQEPQGETAVNVKALENGSTSSSVNCTDEDVPTSINYNKIYSRPAMWCRRAAITNIEIDGEPGGGDPSETPGEGTPGTGPDIVPYDGSRRIPNPFNPIITPPTITTTQKIKDGISKKVLRDLLSECDYFTAIQGENPMIYDSIKQKLKYFTPAFHSMTPEGLNSRLTFLNQCSRPGDTIPTIGTDGKPKYNAATNTAFGAPPVLILRIGDFYNTRIIPTSINITYEPVYDFNPEGIGFQPMIAKIQMGFNFVGGSGLKEPIDTLQNALSFNYYANTEIFDERAEWTDDSFKKLDEDLVKKILDDRGETSGSTIIQNAVQNNGGTFIGVQETREALPESTGGTINYKEFMNNLSATCQNYISTIIGRLTDFKTPYNGTILQIFGKDRLYSKGTAKIGENSVNVEIFGKPDQIQIVLDEWFNSSIKETKQEDLSWQIAFKNGPTGISRSDRLKIYQNIITYLENYKNNFTTDITKIIQGVCESQEALVVNMEKADFVNEKHDGQIKSDQSVEILDISGTPITTQALLNPFMVAANTYEQLVNDYQELVNVLNGFYASLKDVGLLPSDSFDINGTLGFPDPFTNSDAKFLTLMDPVFRDDAKKKEFLDAAVKNTSSPEAIKGTLTEYIITRYYEYALPYIKNVDTLITDWKTKYEQQYTKIEGDKTLERKFDYSVIASPSEDLQTKLRNIYLTGNSNEDKQSFNGKHKFN
jgi:hypothetical protein